MVTATLGTLSYSAGGTVTFDGLTKTRVNCRPIPDKANRTVSHSEITLTVTGYVNLQPTDATIQNWRDVLQRPGGKLNFSSRGFGNLNVNDPANGAVQDVAYGPWPTQFEWRGLGGGNAAEVTWQIVCRIPDTAAYSYHQGLLETCYTVDYDVNEHGYNIVTTSISATIPLTRQSAKSTKPQDDVDRVLESLVPSLQDQFQRMSKRRHLSEDKRTITVTIVDKELTWALPVGVTGFGVRHRIGSSLGHGAFVNWRGSIGGPVYTPKGISKLNAYVRFFTYVNKTLGLTKGDVGAFIPVGTKPGKGTILIDSFEIDEAPWSPETNFALTYRLIGTTFADLLGVSGIFDDPGTDQTKWSQSVFFTAINPRGNAGIKHEAADDVIVDLVIPNQTPVVDTGSSRVPNVANVNPAGIGGPAKPDPANTWIAFENQIFFQEGSGVVQHLPLVGSKQPGTTDPVTSLPTIAPDRQPASDSAITQQNASNIIQRAQNSNYRVHMVGKALRLAYPITPPSIISVGGVQPTLETRQVFPDQPRQTGGYKIYRCFWKITYLVQKKPNSPSLPQPAQPEIKIQGAP